MHTSAWAEITMIQTYGAFAQINDTKNPETFTQRNCGWKNKNNISMAFLMKNTEVVGRRSEGCLDDFQFKFTKKISSTAL